MNLRYRDERHHAASKASATPLVSQQMSVYSMHAKRSLSIAELCQSAPPINIEWDRATMTICYTVPFRMLLAAKSNAKDLLSLVKQAGGRTGVDGQSLSLRQRTALGVAYVFGRYAWTRLETIAAAYHWVDQPQASRTFHIWQLMQWSETGCKLASLANFLVFSAVWKVQARLLSCCESFWQSLASAFVLYSCLTSCLH